VRTSPVARFVSVTLALGRIAPELSVTVPVMSAVVLCAIASGAANRQATSKQTPSPLPRRYTAICRKVECLTTHFVVWMIMTALLNTSWINSRVIAAASLSDRIRRHFMIGESGQMPTQPGKQISMRLARSNLLDGRVLIKEF
jgi:hypothetical protein